MQKIEEMQWLVINEKNKKNENDKNTDENIFYNNNYINLLTIDLPSLAKKHIINALNNLFSTIKKKNDLNDNICLSDVNSNFFNYNYNYNIQHIFFKFFIYIMAG